MGFSDTYDTGKYKVVPKDAVVLDLNRLLSHFSHDEQAFSIGGVVTSLRMSRNISHQKIADQIAEQVKPPRIAVPGKYGVVVAAYGLSRDREEWVNEGKFWRSLDAGDTAVWSDLTNPALVRKGIDD